MNIRIPAPFERPSKATLIQGGLSALTLSFFFYPFIFNSFGKNDNPFDRPRELLSIGLLTLVLMPTIAIVVIAGRIVGPFVSRAAARL